MQKKILILDADINLLVLMSASLAVKGYKVLTSNNGLDGFRLLKQEAPDLLSLDAGLPKMSGYEVVQKLRTLTEDIRKMPVIVTSEKSSMKDLFGPADIHAFLLKPIKPALLIRSAREALEKSAAAGNRSYEKTVILIGMETEVKETVCGHLMIRGYKIHEYDTELKIFSKIHDLRPKIILSQYAEEPDGFNLPSFCNKLAKDPATYHYTCRVLCPMSYVKQADKEFTREALIMYTEVKEIPKKIEPFLQ